MTRAAQKWRTREHVFGCALHLFDERGFEQVNIDDIVRQAEVARGTFYFHFPTKDDVLLELIARSDARIVARMTEARGKGLAAVLRATADGFADGWRDRRELLPHAGAVALRRIAQAEVVADREQQPLRIALAAHVAEAIRTGELASHLPAQMLADVFLLDAFAALMAWARTGQPALALVMSGVIDLFLHGVAPTSATTHRARPAARPARARRR